MMILQPNHLFKGHQTCKVMVFDVSSESLTCELMRDAYLYRCTSIKLYVRSSVRLSRDESKHEHACNGKY